MCSGEGRIRGAINSRVTYKKRRIMGTVPWRKTIRAALGNVKQRDIDFSYLLTGMAHISMDELVKLMFIASFTSALHFVPVYTADLFTKILSTAGKISPISVFFFSYKGHVKLKITRVPLRVVYLLLHVISWCNEFAVFWITSMGIAYAPIIRSRGG